MQCLHLSERFFHYKKQPWLSGYGDGLASSEHGSSPTGTHMSHWWWLKGSDQNSSRAPVQVLLLLVGTSNLLNKAVNGIKFGQTFCIHFTTLGNHLDVLYSFSGSLPY